MAERCTSTTKAGESCTARPRKGTDRCWRHPLDANSADASARDERWSREAFLAAFEDLGMVTGACDRIGIGRTTVYMERQRNEAFAVAWADVEERSTERMEAEAYRRAVTGVETPLVSAGKLVTTVRTYSDGLLTFMLKARRPDKYRDNVKVEHSGTVKTEIVPVAVDRGAAVARLLVGARAVSNGNGNGSHD